MDLDCRYEWNSLGFRNNEFSPLKKENRIRIFCIGGSTTFGTGNTLGDTYPSLLDKLLGEPYEVINAGVSGWGIYQQYERFRKELIIYKPNKIILHSVFNSFCYPQYYFAHNNWPTYFLFNHSLVFRLFDKLLSKTNLFSFHYAILDKEHLENELRLIEQRIRIDNFEKYKETLEAFILLCKDKQIGLIIIIPPLRCDSKFYEQWDEYDPLYYNIRNGCAAAIFDLSKKYSFSIIDMRKLFFNVADIECFFQDAIHPNGKGNEIIANEINKSINNPS